MGDGFDSSRRRFLRATGGVAALSLAGCLGSVEPFGSSNDTDTDASNEAGIGEAQRSTGSNEVDADLSKTLRLVSSTITTLDPVAVTDTASGTVVEQLFDGLTNYPNGETAVESLLAADYRLSADRRTYTFDLKDARYHDGSPVRAQDFVFSFERLAGSEHSARSYFLLDSLGVTHETDSEGKYRPGSIGVRAIDDRTLEITLDEPFHAALEMLAYTAFAAVPEGIVGDVPGYDGEVPYDEFATKGPIGAGPFVFERWQANTEVEVARFENYHSDVPQVAGVHWQLIDDDSAVYEYAMNEDADAFDIPTAKYDREKVTIEDTDDRGRKRGTYGPLRNGKTVQYLSVPLLNVLYVGFNTARVPKPVRQAFAYVTNQGRLVDRVIAGRGEAAYHLTPPSIYPGGASAYTRHAKATYPYGYDTSLLDDARRTMERAGYGPNDRFELDWLQYESSTQDRMTRALRNRLRTAHVDVSVKQVPFSTLLKRAADGNAQAFTSWWIADWPAPDNFVQLLDPPRTDTSRPTPINYTNWSARTGSAARRAARAYDQVARNLGPGERASDVRESAYVTIEEANWEDVSVLPIYHLLGERFWYDWCEIPPFGSMGPSQQKYHRVRIARRRD